MASRQKKEQADERNPTKDDDYKETRAWRMDEGDEQAILQEIKDKVIPRDKLATEHRSEPNYHLGSE